MKLDDRASALLALVESDRERRARALLEPAREGARAEVRQALRDARSRAAMAFAEERSAFAARMGAAEARLATARRMARQRRLKALIARGWDGLPRAMAARWADREARRAWIEAALREALAVLPRGSWRIESAAGVDAAEREQALALAGDAIEATWEDSPRIRAGLRVLRGHVELDATLDGLLDDPASVEARLLHFFEEADR